MVTNRISLCGAVDFGTRSSDEENSDVHVEDNVCDVDLIVTVLVCYRAPWRTFKPPKKIFYISGNGTF